MYTTHPNFEKFSLDTLPNKVRGGLIGHLHSRIRNNIALRDALSKNMKFQGIYTHPTSQEQFKVYSSKEDKLCFLYTLDNKIHTTTVTNSKRYAKIMNEVKNNGNHGTWTTNTDSNDTINETNTNVDLEFLIDNMELVSQYLKQLQELQDNSILVRQSLKHKLAEADQEVMDIRHIIELGNFNASQGYNLAKELQTALKKRRVYKVKIEAVELLTKLTDEKQAQEFNKSLRLLNSKLSYQFRQREDLEDTLPLASRTRAEIIRGEFK